MDLLRGPSAEERDDGLTSAFGSAGPAVLDSVRVTEAGRVVVDFGDPPAAAGTIEDYHRRHPLDGIVAADDQGVLVAALAAAPVAGAQEVVDPPDVLLPGIPFSITARGGEQGSSWVEVRDATGRLLGGGTVEAGATTTLPDLRIASADGLPLQVRIGEVVSSVDATVVPGWFSLMPPLLAIVLALLFREVITALVAGVWLGCLAVAGFNPLTATWRMIDSFIVPALGDVDGGHTQIVVFSLLLGGMVGIVARNGGTMGIVEAVAPFARDARRGKLATFLAGLAIFFDDYANTLIVGNTMRPITDRLRISREKLAYLVDSTAAPVAAIVPISTWVGYEISLIGDGFRIAAEQNAGRPELVEGLLTTSPFGVFIHTIPYLFYPLLALAFVFLTSAMNRDFGAMAAAEERAGSGRGLHRAGAQLAMDTEGGGLDAREGVAHRWWNAGIPVITVVVVVLVGLWTTGRASAGADASIMDVFGAADPFATLLWGSLAGCIVAFVLTVSQRLLTMKETIDAWLSGMRAMMIAMIILVLAWSLGAVTEAVGTAGYLAALLEGNVMLQLLPVMVFLVAAAIAFATGTSWGTMAILIPLVIPLTVSLGGGIDFDGGTHYTVLLGVISSVLAGSIFGDHCSPISDTTVLSSTASGCDHVDHVRTQLPYALAVAVVAMAVGDIPTAFGFPTWISLLVGLAILWA
ncbi:MAG: Na+/H+ antiporter NhaC family protein, partial [Gemmatimonadetes bacterium]|nr:Na+/H+ antiporter NhaC family protein [Gemmatimonadota bacterium]